jgi:hypothetical protein
MDEVVEVVVFGWELWRSYFNSIISSSSSSSVLFDLMRDKSSSLLFAERFLDREMAFL